VTLPARSSNLVPKFRFEWVGGGWLGDTCVVDGDSGLLSETPGGVGWKGLRRRRQQGRAGQANQLPARPTRWAGLLLWIEFPLLFPCLVCVFFLSTASVCLSREGKGGMPDIPFRLEARWMFFFSDLGYVGVGPLVCVAKHPFIASSRDQSR